jgi:repressor LexA
MTTPSDLTPRQRDVLEVIERALARDGYPPTRAEIAQALGFRSANAAQEHLQSLQRKGLVELGGSHRGIRLLQPAARAKRTPARTASAPEMLELPLVGRVAAGAPILASENIDAHYRLDPALFSGRPDFLLAVRGESMRDAGVLDGDLVAVRRAHEPRNGEMVVARIDDEATVKTFERRGERIRLLPANPAFAPIVADPRVPLVIEGVVVGVIRRATGTRR